MLTASHAAASNRPCHDHLPPTGRAAFKSKSLYHCCAAFSIQSCSQALTAELIDSARPQETKYSFSNIARNSVWKAAQFSSEEHEAWRLMIRDLGFKLPFNTKFEMFMKNYHLFITCFSFSPASISKTFHVLESKPAYLSLVQDWDHMFLNYIWKNGLGLSLHIFMDFMFDPGLGIDSNSSSLTFKFQNSKPFLVKSNELFVTTLYLYPFLLPSFLSVFSEHNTFDLWNAEQSRRRKERTGGEGRGCGMWGIPNGTLFMEMNNTVDTSRVGPVSWERRKEGDEGQIACISGSSFQFC